MSACEPITNSSYQTVIAQQLYRRAQVAGRIALPAVPDMLDDYVLMCDNVFKAIGVFFSEVELTQLRGALSTELDMAFKASHRSEIIISYESPIGSVLNYHIKAHWYSIEAEYEKWFATRKHPLFGTEPDARVWNLALAAQHPGAFPILDMGAGTGRNTLPLARRGHAVDAIEVTTKFADVLQVESSRESLNVRIFKQDIFDDLNGLRSDYQLIILSEVVPDFLTSEQLQKTFTIASRSLATGGRFVFNTFVAKQGYIPDAAARQLGQQCYTAIFTRSEISAAAEGLTLELESDVSAYDYEKENIPVSSWPPTSWYEAWAHGQDVFGIEREHSPIELRWLVYRKVG